MPSETTQILVPFGFTALESEIYTFLLGEPPSTGYRIAQAIGKAAANTYKAIESLQQKGAILVDEGSNRLCRAVPSDELLARLARDFEWRRAEAEIKLSRLRAARSDDRIYVLRSRAQVIERARQMLGAAEETALLVCQAEVAAELSDGLYAALRRNASIYVGCPQALGIEGIFDCQPKAPMLDELRIAVDGSQCLLALFGEGSAEPIQALWTKSGYVSVSAYRGLAAELDQWGLQTPPVESTLGFLALP